MEKIFTVTEVARMLKISRPTVYRHIANGLLHPVKLGGRTMFKEKDLNAFIRSLPPVRRSNRQK